MQATDILMSEHRVIERVIAAMEAEADRLTAGQPVRPGFFLDAADFVKGFADGCHHVKEEGVLFPTMVENGLPLKVGPIAVMLGEHEQGRAYIRALREAATRLQDADGADAGARQAVVDNARGYASLLRNHIFKEDSVLFPMANEMIPAAEQPAVLEAFEHVEHEDTGAGVHEKYLALAERLEQEAVYA